MILIKWAFPNSSFYMFFWVAFRDTYNVFQCVSVCGMNVFIAEHHLPLNILIFSVPVTWQCGGDPLLHTDAQSKRPLFLPAGLPLTVLGLSFPRLVTMEKAAPSAFVFGHQVLMKMVSLMLISYINERKSCVRFALLMLFGTCSGRYSDKGLKSLIRLSGKRTCLRDV